MFLLHSGQTGVERGAQRAATMLHGKVAGFCTPTRRDEMGPIPVDVARALTPCNDNGPRAAVDANLAIASALVVIVPERRLAATYTGIAALLRNARARGVPYAVADAQSDPQELLAWIETVPVTSGSLRCLVTGPRGTRWPEGDRVGWRIVSALLSARIPFEQQVIPA